LDQALRQTIGRPHCAHSLIGRSPFLRIDLSRPAIPTVLIKQYLARHVVAIKCLLMMRRQQSVLH
jgi:hypothetical protein